MVPAGTVGYLKLLFSISRYFGVPQGTFGYLSMQLLLPLKHVATQRLGKVSIRIAQPSQASNNNKPIGAVVSPIFGSIFRVCM